MKIKEAISLFVKRRVGRTHLGPSRGKFVPNLESQSRGGRYLPTLLHAIVVEYLLITRHQMGRQLPSQRLIFEPQSNQMALPFRRILERLPRVENGEVVDEAQITGPQRKAQLVFLGHLLEIVEALELFR